jgi:3'-phosphoadenosine 5'-phosphosulfate (PAPS) 3'-phosphatase
MDDHALARELAEAAGERLLGLRAERGFDDPGGLREAGDRRSHDYLAAELAERCPGDAVLSEESAESRTDRRRLAADRVWIIDPLDGTREFGEEGRRDWAVHVALWRRDAPAGSGRLAAGAVALPAQGTTLSTTPAGAYAVPAGTTAGTEGTEATGEAAVLPRRRAPATGNGAIRIAVSRTRPPEFVTRLARRLEDGGTGVELVPIGSAGAKISAVLLGEVDAYVHAGGQYEWDSAAPAAVALAAGARACRVDGSALAYNQNDFRLPDILVCLPELSATLLAAIDDVTRAIPTGGTEAARTTSKDSRAPATAGPTGGPRPNSPDAPDDAEE